jgi:hypothetical protein
MEGMPVLRHEGLNMNMDINKKTLKKEIAKGVKGQDDDWRKMAFQNGPPWRQMYMEGIELFNSDIDIMHTFVDLLSLRNRNHWDEMDLENFLAAKGRFVSECITHLQTDGNDVIPSVLTSEKFKNIKKLIVCVYSHSAMTLADYGKILEQARAALSAGTEILTGWICDEKTDQSSVAVNLIAVCSD